MENSTLEDSYGAFLPRYLVSDVLCATLAFAGLLIQSFIVTVNVIDWLKRKSITGADQIITSIGISRIFYHTALLLALFSSFYVTKIPEVVFDLYNLIQNISAFASIWLSTLLSIFFCVKILTFHNVFFLRLKAIILEKITYLIIGSVLLSLGYSLVFFLALPMLLFSNDFSDSELQIIQFVYMFWNFFPVLTFFIASLFVIISLGFHMCRMNRRGNVTSSTDTFLRIMKFTIVSFLACATYITITMFQGHIFYLYIVTLNIFPALHSVLLIYVTTKLRNLFCRIVHSGTKQLFMYVTQGVAP
uniref:Taste receptor type 2 n=1 Tax=Pyxicephalus adspersus TaxID=30357 RepID=A0AAV3ACU8_PYXAD|nr:TPA: hypothetical protein GDO54_009875 [Pyxicephalus adspersus]